MSEWKNITNPDFADYYSVSSNGEVVSSAGGKKKILKLHQIKSGDIVVTLNKADGGKINTNVDLLVANAFIPNPKKYNIIRHLNGNLTDCCATNLEWTSAYNNPNFDNVVDLDGEQWVSIADYEDLYEVSNFGRIKNKSRDVLRPSDGKWYALYADLIPEIIDQHGYKTVALKKNGTSSSKKVHLLVAQAFVPQKENKTIIEHIDGNRYNNAASNLRWIGVTKEDKNKVIVIFNDGHIETFDNAELASVSTGIPRQTIIDLCNHSVKKTKSGISCEWVDKKQKQSKIGKQNKAKGNRFELEVVNKLKEIGFTGCMTSRSESKRKDNDKIDIVDKNNELPINLQTKYISTNPSYFTIRDECTDKSLPFGIIWKKSTNDGTRSPGTIAMIPVDFFYELLRLWKNNN